MKSKSKLKLYIAGQTPKSECAVSNVHGICDKQLEVRYEIEVIDILERLQLAEDDKILATPTVIKESPLPVRCISGDFSDSEKVFSGFDIIPLKNCKK